MSKPNLEDVSKAVRSRAQEKADEAIASVFKDIVERPKNQLPETVFVNVFLEHFKNPPEDFEKSTLTLKWLELAGSHFDEVEVVDQNNKVLYTVPSLYAPPQLDMDIMSQFDFNKIRDDYSLEIDRIPELAEKMLAADLDGVEKGVITNPKPIQDQWLSIFNRYTDQVDEVSDHYNTITGVDLSEDIDYD